MHEESHRGGITAGLLAVLAAAAGLYTVFIARSAFRIGGITYFTLVDDAMVSMRYAQHLARGFGLVWNLGQKPVEGFTNPAWMLIMAAFHLLPIPAAKVSLAVMLISALILLANVVVVYRICQALRPRSGLAPLVAAGLTAFYFPLVFWALRGMEVGLLVLLIDLAVLLAIRTSGISRREAVIIGILLSLGVFTRLDALLQAILIIAYLMVIATERRNVLVPLALVVLSAGAILAFQKIYFGDFLPNTYYQKMAGTDLVERLRNGLLVFYQHALWDTLLPGLVSLACLVLYNDLRRPATLLLGALFAVQCLYSVWVGGDYAEVEVDAANRFITQGMPALIILFSMSLDRIVNEQRLPFTSGPRRSAALAAGAAILALAIMTGRPWSAWLRNNAPLLAADIRRTRQGVLLAKYTDPGAVIAVHAAGQIPYYSERTTIDLLGLNDPVIAKGPVTGPFYPGHDKWNYAYSIGELQPDVIADNWIKLAAFMKERSEYVRLESGVYVRRDSKLVDATGLAQNYR